ncbi:MAG: HAMP domain-containing sensor histidine kinase [Bacteroidota bacterium]
MKVQHMYVIIGLMTLALLGLIGLQVQQIRKAMVLNEVNFINNVNEALEEVVSELEGDEVRMTFVQASRQLALAPSDSTQHFTSGNTTISLEFTEGERVAPRHTIRIRDSLAIVTEQEATIQFDSALFQAGGTLSYMFLTSEEDSLGPDSRFEFRGNPEMVRMVKQTLDGLSGPHIPIQDRVDSIQIDTLLQEALASRGIYQGYEFVVETDQNRVALATSLSPGSPMPIHWTQASHPHQIQLFPNLGSIRQSHLYVRFPDSQLRAFQAVWVQALASLMFCAIILVCFWIAIRTVFRQKKFSEMKNDFINNMTHELKTPIATISLAADAISNPQISGNPDGMKRYTRIIKEENQRMHRQVERVLQAARLQRKEIRLDPSEFNLHDLLTKAGRYLELPMQERGGHLNLDLRATRTVVQGDEQHLINLINNLLDNANKYSSDQPNITLRTFNEADQLVIQVQDQGMGISKADQARIFERFYRVSTGNLHEVKGFGLGLSYAKAIAQAHGGDISVQSQLGQGSTFELRLPLEPEATPLS